MKAALVREYGAGFVTEEVEIATPIGREVLVHVKASGLCHTDLSMSQFDLGTPLPLALGHEVAGVVAAIGPEVSEFAIGDHVVGCLIQACGICVDCLAGRSYQCRHPEKTLRKADQPPRLSVRGCCVTQGFGLGGFAQKALIHENQLVKIDERVPFPQAALLGCGVVTGAGAVINTSNTQAGDSVVIIGVGGVGLNAINGAIVAGASAIIAIDISDDKLQKAKKFGATHTINLSKVDAVAEVLAITCGGANAVFDFVGAPAVTQSGLDMLRVGGGLYLIGATDPTSSIQVSNLNLVLSQKKIQGVYMGSTTAKRDIPLYAEMYLQGRFELDGLVSREIGLDAVNEGYAALKEPGVARVVITSGLS